MGNQVGNLIVIEGACDGIGKSTQCSLVRDKISSGGEDVVTHHFPSYNTWHGAPIERYLKGELGPQSTLGPKFIHSLYAFDRSVVSHEVLQPAYEQGKTILLDRYTSSSLIYQTALFQTDDEKISFVEYAMNYEYNVLGILRPTDVIFLNAPWEVITDMRNKRTTNEGIARDMHEKDIYYLNHVYDTAQLISKHLGWPTVNCCFGDNNLRPIEDIHTEVMSYIKK